MNAQELIGLTKNEAIKMLKASGIDHRVSREDNERYITTMDYWPERINLEIEKGIVVKVENG